MPGLLPGLLAPRPAGFRTLVDLSQRERISKQKIQEATVAPPGAEKRDFEAPLSLRSGREKDRPRKDFQRTAAWLNPLSHPRGAARSSTGQALTLRDFRGHIRSGSANALWLPKSRVRKTKKRDKQPGWPKVYNLGGFTYGSRLAQTAISGPRWARGRVRKVCSRAHRNRAWAALLLLAGLLWVAGAARAQQAESPAPAIFGEALLRLPDGREVGGSHFILLIDDSGDMRAFRSRLKEMVPNWLYGGVPISSPAPETRFDPARDKLTVLFFTMKAEPREGTKLPRPTSLMPQHIFTYQPVGAATLADREAFAAGLETWLASEKRFQGTYSPIATAPRLCLGFIKEVGEDATPVSRLFRRVLLAVVTNSAANTAGTPVVEIDTFEHYGLSKGNANKVRDLAQEMEARFRLDVRAMHRGDDRGLWYSVYPVIPYDATEGRVTYASRIEVAPLAVGRGMLRVSAREDAMGLLRVTPSEELKPLTWRWRFEDTREGPWKIAGHEVPGGSLPLEPCQAPLCWEADTQKEIALFRAIERSSQPQFSFSARDVIPGARLVFRVGFQVDPQGRVYSRLVHEFEKAIQLEPVMAETVDLWPWFRQITPETVLSLWKPSDNQTRVGGLSYQAARGRLSWSYTLRWAAFVTFLFLLLWAWFYFCRHRRFHPVIEWSSLTDGEVDLNNPRSVQYKIGSLIVRNEGRAGFPFRNEEPSRRATFIIEPRLPTELELDTSRGTLLGFTAAGNRVALGTENIEIKHGTPLDVSLNEAVLKDLLRRPEPGETMFERNVAVTVRLQWKPKPLFHLFGLEGEGASTQFRFLLRVKPEQPRLPQLGFQQTEEQRQAEFALEKDLAAGRFLFSSSAEHRFALPYEGSHSVLAYRYGRAVHDSRPFRLEPERVKVESQASDLPTTVLLLCDGEKVINPQASYEKFEFQLEGEVAAGSLDRRGIQTFLLQRSSKRTEVSVLVTPLVGHREEHEVNWPGLWDGGGEAKVRLNTGPRADTELESQNGRLVLDQVYPVNVVRNAQAQGLLKVDIIRSSPSAEGVVHMELRPRLDISPEQNGRLHMRPAFELHELLTCAPPRLTLGGRNKRESIEVQIEPGRISKIDGTDIAVGDCHAEVEVLVTIEDGGERRDVCLAVRLPLGLRQELGPNCLVIDAGTSAIAAAVGIIGEDHCVLIDLQGVPVVDGEGHRQSDGQNPERDGHLLPSWVICNADERRDTDNRHKANEGHPLYSPASLVPGRPSFLGLPATTNCLRTTPERVIFSLKSWLGTSASEIRMQAPIPFKRRENEPEVHSELLPLDEVVESGFAGLASAYLKPYLEQRRLQPDQVILCHPNTFTPIHQDRLKEIGERALFGPLKLDHESQITLISESDAVAYYYCDEERRRRRRTGEERILVYDFGAGTLDVTVLCIRWNENPCYPVDLLKRHLGVPIAGNYFDELLARLVHRWMERPGVLGPDLFHKYPAVADQPDPANPHEHGLASRNLWLHLREAKHAWDGTDDLRVRVGNVNEQDRVVRFSQRPYSLTGPFEHGPNNDVVLRIPAEDVHTDPDIEGFLRFVTEDVVDETLALAEVNPDQIDTVIISGRGALWPGLRQKLLRRLPNAREPELFTTGFDMKYAVVRGAIGRQQLAKFSGQPGRAANPPRIGILFSSGTDFKLITDNDYVVVNLSGSHSFRVVQVACGNPDPRNDMKGLREHFYIDLASSTGGILRTQMWSRNPELRARKFRDRDGRFKVELLNSDNQPMVLEAGSRVSSKGLEAPWPIGDPLLRPKVASHVAKAAAARAGGKR